MWGERLGALLLPGFLLMLHRRWFLSPTEQALLVLNCLLLCALALGGWPAHLAFLTGTGYHHLILFEAARSTQLFRRHKEGEEFVGKAEWLFTMNINEVKLFMYLVYFWILIKITALKSLSFDMGGGTFLTLLDGWNCTLAQFWVINTIWLVLVLASAFACLYLIQYDRESDTLYKRYLFKYKVIWDVAVTIFVVAFNYLSYTSCHSLAACLTVYQGYAWARYISFWGIPASTLLFFVKKQGVFEEAGSERAEGENDHESLEKQLNEIEVDRQFSQLGSKSLQK